MGEVAVKLGYGAKIGLAFHSQNCKYCTDLGCKRSLVQIQSRRPSYLIDILRFLERNCLRNYTLHVAHNGSNRQIKDGIGGGKIGVRPVNDSSVNHAVLKRTYRLNSNKFHQKLNIIFKRGRGVTYG